jgi:hypothetical protein
MNARNILTKAERALAEMSQSIAAQLCNYFRFTDPHEKGVKRGECTHSYKKKGPLYKIQEEYIRKLLSDHFLFKISQLSEPHLEWLYWGFSRYLWEAARRDSFDVAPSCFLAILRLAEMIGHEDEIEKNFSTWFSNVCKYFDPLACKVKILKNPRSSDVWWVCFAEFLGHVYVHEVSKEIQLRHFDVDYQSANAFKVTFVLPDIPHDSFKTRIVQKGHWGEALTALDRMLTCIGQKLDESCLVLPDKLPPGLSLYILEHKIKTEIATSVVLNLVKEDSVVATITKPDVPSIKEV